jgi:glycosyltransferase involved in cell wall biosynthesis
MLGNYMAKTLHVMFNEYRVSSNIKGIFGFLSLWRYAFKHAKGNINLTVQRMVFPVLLAGILNGGKTIVVLHHYDKKEQNSWLYHLNIKLLIYLLKLDMDKLKVVVVADYWKEWLLNKGVKEASIYVVPNLFDNEAYESLKHSIVKKEQIYLGQFGAKQHPLVFEIAKDLKLAGYYCFFTTPFIEGIQLASTFEVKHLTFEAYLKELASSLYAVCLTSFNEGWNRTAHESLMLGTPVVGNDAGGLGQLLKESHQPIVSTKDEVIALILQKQNIHIPDAFLKQYHISQILYYARPLVAYCGNGFS